MPKAYFHIAWPTEVLLMSTHDICFCEAIRNISMIFC